VREKLEFAKSLEHTVQQRDGESSFDWGELSPALAINIAALTKAQPKDLDASEISVCLGATWVDPVYYQQFAYEVLQTPANLQNMIKVEHSNLTGEWNVSGKTAPSSNDIMAYEKYGTDRANAYIILENSLNLRDVRVYDTTIEHGKEVRKLNTEKTLVSK